MDDDDPRLDEDSSFLVRRHRYARVRWGTQQRTCTVAFSASCPLESARLIPNGQHRRFKCNVAFYGFAPWLGCWATRSEAAWGSLPSGTGPEKLLALFLSHRADWLVQASLARFSLPIW
jgi:hypothetical protein